MNIKKLELNPKWGLNFGSFKPQSAIDMAKQAGRDGSGRVGSNGLRVKRVISSGLKTGSGQLGYGSG